MMLQFACRWCRADLPPRWCIHPIVIWLRQVSWLPELSGASDVLHDVIQDLRFLVIQDLLEAHHRVDRVVQGPVQNGITSSCSSSLH